MKNKKGFLAGHRKKECFLRLFESGLPITANGTFFFLSPFYHLFFSLSLSLSPHSLSSTYMSPIFSPLFLICHCFDCHLVIYTFISFFVFVLNVLSAVTPSLVKPSYIQ